MTKLDTIAKYISYGTLLVSFISVIVVTFWLVYPYKPIVLNSAKLLTHGVDAGSHIKYELDYCKNMDLPATVVRAFVNGVVFSTPSIVTNNPVGCRVNTNVFTVPSELPSGMYLLRTTWIYQVNPIRKVSVTFSTDQFKVNGSDLDRQANQE